MWACDKVCVSVGIIGGTVTIDASQEQIKGGDVHTGIPCFGKQNTQNRPPTHKIKFPIKGSASRLGKRQVYDHENLTCNYWRWIVAQK